MTSDSILALVAIILCGSLVVAAVIRKWWSVASWSFAAGMLSLAATTAFLQMSIASLSAPEAIFWRRLALVAKSFLPGFWLCFSLTYARGNYREFLIKWRLLLLAAFVLPVGIAVGFWGDLFSLARADSGQTWIVFGQPARLLNAIVLVAVVLVLSNLEKTFRAAVGTMRWRIKFLVMGLGVIFGTRIYTSSQALLFSTQDISLIQVEIISLIIGCGLMTVGYLRSGFAEIDIYPSQAVLRGSITVLIAGGYLFLVGVLAQIVTAMGGVRYFQAQAFLVLLGLTGLGMLLLSDRIRQESRRFVSRHFRRPQHDFRRVWTLFTERISNTSDESSLCGAAAKLFCETFGTLSVTIWLVNDDGDQIVIGASTSKSRQEKGESQALTDGSGLEIESLRQHAIPFDLETAPEPWAETLRKSNPSEFHEGGNRIAVPLLSGDRWLGLVVVADRVGGLSYTAEEIELLKCIGDQLAASLLNLRLAEENLHARELEAFQTLSAFFVHDLKNAASGLNLTLQNLPRHFDDPAFRADALRGIAGTVERINSLIERLSLLRGKFEIRPVELDLNQLIEETLASFHGALGVEVEMRLAPVPRLMADRDQLRSVINNLILNARDAVNGTGRIVIATDHNGNEAILTVADNGCGMSDEFLRHSLFRPFRTTKNKGIGIGMFQAKVIVQAHRGTIRVESEPQKGSTFRVALPIPKADS